MLLKRDCVGAEAFEVAILGGLIFCLAIPAVGILAPNISKVFLAESSPVKLTSTSYGVKATNFDDTLPSKKLIAVAHQDLSIKANNNTFPERSKYPSNVTVKNVYTEPVRIHPANVYYNSQEANNNYSQETYNNESNNYTPPSNNYTPPSNNYTPPSNDYYSPPVYTPAVTTTTTTSKQGGCAGTNVGLGTFTTSAANQSTVANRVTTTSNVNVKSSAPSSSAASRNTTAPAMGVAISSSTSSKASVNAANSSSYSPPASSAPKFIAPNPMSSGSSSSSRSSSSSSSSSSSRSSSSSSSSGSSGLSTAAQNFLALIMSLGAKK